MLWAHLERRYVTVMVLELDMVVMGQLLGFVADSRETGGIRHNPQLRQQMSCQFLLRGVKVNTESGIH